MAPRTTTRLVVIGAGAAGCALAARLAERTDAEVVLLEAGGSDWSPLVKVPLAVGKALRGGLYGWHYETEAIQGAGGRRVVWPRGKVLGGSTSINGMIYIRGSRSDFDSWQQLGVDGWSYDDVLPYFRRSEGHLDRGGPFHGDSGPWGVRKADDTNPLYNAFVDSGVAAGFQRNDDFNGASQDGFGRYDFCIKGGLRSSSATAFLPLARRRRNFRLITRALVTRLVIEGRRVRGVEFRSGGRKERLHADELFLCGGVINSPQLLLLSGVGDPADLEKVGVKPVHALPGVGEGLSDHIQVPLRFACNQPLTLHSEIRIDRMALAMARAMVVRSGPATRFPVEAGAFTRSNPALPDVDLQWFFVRSLGVARIRGFGGGHALRDPLMQEGFTISLSALQPRGRGSVTLRSADPLAKPLIAPRWFEGAEDIDTFVNGIEQVRDVASRAPLSGYIRSELSPSSSLASRAELERYIRSHAGPGHHQVGTCRMGSDEESVVDDRLRVHGLDGLRVVDASVMPRIVRGNTAAATVMLAERCADFVFSS